MWFFFCLFLIKRLLHFLCSLLYMQENVQTNIKGKTLTSSPSQMFFKIGVLKHFAVLSRKHLSWSPFLLKLQTWGLSSSFKSSLLYKTIPKFYVIIEFVGRLCVQNWYFSYLSCPSFCSFITLLESVFHGYSVLVFVPKFLVSVTFVRITKSTPALFRLNR